MYIFWKKLKVYLFSGGSRDFRGTGRVTFYRILEVGFGRVVW